MSTAKTEERPVRSLPRLKQRYRDEVVGSMQGEFNYANVMQVPGLTKIVVNMGVGEAARDSKLIEGAVKDLTAITGQKPQVTKARKSIAQFKLREEFSHVNVNQVARIVKVVVNMGVGEAARDSKLIEGAVKDLTAITGQKPQVTKARKSIAQFKLREGMPIGAHVTLRGDRMWEFLDRLLSLALPRIRDFRGLSDRQFDGKGNYTFGLTEQVVFHEIDQDRIDRVRGFDITIVTTAKTDDEGRALLRSLGFPFRTAENSSN